MSELWVTGLGPVTPIGSGLDELTAAWAGRESGLSVPGEDGPLAGIEASAVAEVGEVPEFDVADYLESEKTYLDRSAALLLAGSAVARSHAQLTISEGNRLRVGVCAGSAYGPLASQDLFNQRVLAKGARLANPLIFGHTYINTAASLVAIEWGLMGFNEVVSCGLVSGMTAIVQAADALRLGRADALLCGGADALSVPLVLGLAAEGRLAVDGGVGLRPAEGAGVVVLETSDSASARGADPVGYLEGSALGYGDAAGDALCDVVSQTLEEAAARASDIDLVVGCANGVPAVDEAEAAVVDCFGWAARLCSPKRLTGETFGAADGIGVAIALLALEADGRAVVLSCDWSGACGALVVRRR